MRPGVLYVCALGTVTISKPPSADSHPGTDSCIALRIMNPGRRVTKLLQAFEAITSGQRANCSVPCLPADVYAISVH